MPKIKAKKDSEELDLEKTIKTEPKDILLDDEEKILDVDLVPGDVVVDEESDEDDVSGMDDDEVDPFKDKWEE